MLDSLIFQNFASKRLQEDEVEIEVRAFGINFRDVLIALGQMKDSSIMAVRALGSLPPSAPTVNHASVLVIECVPGLRLLTQVMPMSDGATLLVYQIPCPLM